MNSLCEFRGKYDWSEKGLMKILIIFNREPYDNTDITWNGLRLAARLTDDGHSVSLFLMNDAVDLARDICKPPEHYDQDLFKMLKALTEKGVNVGVCGTCMARCGIYKNHPYTDGVESAGIQTLADWVVGHERVISF